LPSIFQPVPDPVSWKGSQLLQNALRVFPDEKEFVYCRVDHLQKFLEAVEKLFNIPFEFDLVFGSGAFSQFSVEMTGNPEGEFGG
jgi:hypothetical protein